MLSGGDYDDSKVFIDLSNDYESLKISAVNPYIQSSVNVNESQR